MNILEKYSHELEDLIDNQDNISFFCDLINNSIRYNDKFVKDLIDTVIKYCEENGLNEAKAWMLYYVGWNYIYSSNFTKGIEIFKYVKNVFEKNDNYTGLAYSYNGLATAYCQSGYFELSNELSLKGIALAKEIKNDILQYKMLLNSAITNLQSNMFDTAKEIIDYVKDKYTDLSNDMMGLIVLYKIEAEIEINIGDASKALELLQKALDIDKVNGISIFSTEIAKLIGCAYAKLNNYEKADENLQIAYDIAKENKYLYEQCEALIEWGKFKFQIHMDDFALNYLDEAISISKEHMFYKIIRSASDCLYNYYKNLNHYENTLKYLEIYIQIDELIHKNVSLKEDINKSTDETTLHKILHDKTELLSNLGQNLISILNVDEMFKIISKEINNLLDVNLFGVTLYTEEDKTIIDRYTTDKDNIKINIKGPIKAELHSVFIAYCIKNKRTMVIDNIFKEYKKITKNSDDIKNIDMLSRIFIPLIINDKVIGVIYVQNRKDCAYDLNDINILKIVANYVAVSLKNAVEYAKMEQIAVYDSLTGFLTKQEIINEGNNIVEEYKKKKKSFCILMLDLDDFKHVNDTYGHVAGDTALKLVTQTIGRLIRVSDIIGRYGGDEFLLICQNISKKNCVKLAERIRSTVENTNFILDDNTSIKLTLSIGVYEYCNEQLSFLEGVNFSDLTMYKAKKSNKNIVEVL